MVLLLLLSGSGAALPEAGTPGAPSGPAAPDTPTAPAPIPDRRFGTVLPLPPDVAPGRIAPLPVALLDAAIERRVQGDTAGAIRHYEAWLASVKDSRLRAAGWIVLGHLYDSRGDHTIASALYNRARASGTPVAPWGTWHQARADYARGAFTTVTATCAAYLEAWPEGPQADDCLLLTGDAWAAAGKRSSASAAYQKWLLKHPESPLQENIQLRLALATSIATPAASVAELRGLLLSHQYHSTGMSAEARLEELVAAGVIAEVLPQDGKAMCQMANEQRRCGFEQEAWDLYRRIQEAGAHDPDLASWAAANQDDFLRSTKQYEELAARFQDALAKKPDANLAWERYRLLAKAGQWAAAADQLIDGAKRYGGKFTAAKTDTARAQLLAGRYDDAAIRWTAIGGAEGRWLAAYATFRQEKYTAALPLLQAVEAAGGEEAGAARWYRYRALLGLGRSKEAEALRLEIAGEGANSWYGLLARQASSWGAPLPAGDLPLAPPAVAPALRLRNGRWPGALMPLSAGGAGDSAADPARRAPAGGAVSLGWSAPEQPHPDLSGQAPALPDGEAIPPISWGGMGWRRVANVATAGSSPPPVPMPEAASLRPDSYEPAFFFDPAAGWRLLDGLSRSAPVAFPFAAGAADLGRVGAWEDAAPVVSRMYDQMEADRKAGKGSAYAAVTLSVAEWRQIFLLVRDDHHTTKLMWGVPKTAGSADARLSAMRALYPTAHIDAVYRHGWRWSVDPLMVLGLMRQESVYKQWALSHVGAIGLMQIMPKTGSRVAALMGDGHYSPSELEDPSLNIRYGIYYLSRLLDRFGGAFPMAVGSYNGGPHNMGSWLRPWGARIRMDDFVEQIPYPETRDYIKKVSGYYSVYVSLYAPEGSTILVPDRVWTDDRRVIDF